MSADKPDDVPASEVEPGACPKDARGNSKHLGLGEILNTFFTGVIALTAIVGTALLVGEFRELKIQNSHLNRSLKQSYRPVGIVYQPTSQEHLGQTQFLPLATRGEKNSWNLFYAPLLTNGGHGLLSYIGHVYTVVWDQMDFRERFLEGRAGRVAFDGLSGYARGQSLAPVDSLRLVFYWKHLAVGKRFFLYALIFYKDQDGDLFDTEHLMSAAVLDTSGTDTTQAFRIGTAPGTRDNYHSYTDTERRVLRHRLLQLKHPLAGHL
ncbi:MAG: hypothetical protein NTX17_05835 [Candidatus Eisenbacteria bacterium]|nr:hypothetical protein [Candidatus Eisenbacteria bacterium]